MILTVRGQHLHDQLIKILPGNLVDSHLLIRAFLTVNLPKEMNRISCERYVLGPVMNGSNIELRRSIEVYDLEDYLMFVAPFEVADIKSFLRYRDNNQQMGDIDLIVSLLIIRDLGFEAVLKSHASVRRMYDAYVKDAKDMGIRYINDNDGSFGRFLNAIYSYSLDSEATRIQKVGDNALDARVRRIVGVLYDDFHLDRNEAFDLCAEIHEKDPPTAREIEVIVHAVRAGRHWCTSPIARKENALEEGRLPPEEFIVQHDGKQMTLLDSKIKSVSKDLFEVTVNNGWYGLACGLYIYQKRCINRRFSEHEAIDGELLANDVERPNDVALELSLLNKLLRQNKRYNKNRFLVVFPSPYLVHEIFEDIENDSFDVKFIMESESLANITRAWVFDPRQAQNRKRILHKQVVVGSFLDINPDASGYTDILIEEVKVSGKDYKYRAPILNLFSSVGKGNRLIVLSRDAEMHCDYSLFRKVDRKDIKGIYSIPIQTVGTEVKKNIWVADLSNGDLSDAGDADLDVYLFHKARYDHENIRRIYVDNCSPLHIGYNQYICEKKPIRSALNIAYTRNGESKRRNPPRFIEFCPEISFKYYIFSKPGSPRGVKYVAYFTDGNKDYGKITNQSAKSFSEFRDWLMNEYIYKKVRVNKGARGGNGGKETESVERKHEADFYYSRGQTYSHWIRDVIGNQYKGANVSLRGFWAFNPDAKVEFKISAEEYELLKKLMQSDMGNVYLSEITGEKVDELVSANGALEDIDTSYVVELLSRLLSRAVKNGNIAHNPLLDDDGKDYSYTGMNVRNALARRTLSEDKFRELFNMVYPHDDDIKAENLALLMRMLTGISTAEAAALRWSDLITIDLYAVKIHALLVSKRIAVGSNETINHAKATCYRILPLNVHKTIYTTKYIVSFLIVISR